MFKYLPILLLAPLFSAAQQEVKPVVSDDYLSLIQNDSLLQGKAIADFSANNKKEWRLKQPFSQYSKIASTRFKNGTLKIVPVKNTRLLLGGNFTTSVTITQANQLPALQNEYVQGRSVNGQLQWQGPETNELFSYGPALSSLEFDGGIYEFDRNGKLVPSGNGSPAMAYNNSIFRTGYSLSNSVSLLGKIVTNTANNWLFSLKASTNKENLVIRQNVNSGSTFAASLEKTVRKHIISSSYSIYQAKFSNNNRNGFLNKVYMDALLTPVSFDNSQGNILPNGSQRAYSAYANNASYLLADNGNSFSMVQQTGNLTVQKKYGRLIYGLVQSVDNVNERSAEAIKPGTANFLSGIVLNRDVDTRTYNLNSYGVCSIRYGGYRFNSTAKLGYIINDEHAAINYRQAQSKYQYQRLTNQFSVAYNTTYDYHATSAGMNVSNKVYVSNTSVKNKFFLPELSGYFKMMSLFNINRLSLKLSSYLNTYCNELPVSTSFSTYQLTQYNTHEATKFLPIKEVSGFTNVRAIQRTDYSAKAELNYSNTFSLSAEVFTKKAKGDIYPVYNNGLSVLKNIADHNYKGFEVLLDVNRYTKPSRKLTVSGTLSLYKWKTKVTHVEPGYDYLPISGFANVHKAIVEGQPIGVIVGNTWLRNADGQPIIGSDGFPIADNKLSVIADPTPDYTIKTTHTVNWRKFTLNVYWEYKKGGQMWNGTQAVLDYYGRSATSGSQRNITDYVFAGVLQNGHTNNKAVNFYDPTLPVESNRWVRYGYTGVAESYIESADAVRLTSLSLGYTLTCKKYIQKIRFNAFAQNLLIWTAYKGADPNRLLFDQPNSAGLDFFNLPSTKSFGFDVTIQF